MATKTCFLTSNSSIIATHRQFRNNVNVHPRKLLRQHSTIANTVQGHTVTLSTFSSRHLCNNEMHKEMAVF